MPSVNPHLTARHHVCLFPSIVLGALGPMVRQLSKTAYILVIQIVGRLGVWRKTEDQISISQLEADTGFSRGAIIQAVAEAVEYGILLKHRNSKDGKHRASTYSLNECWWPKGEEPKQGSDHPDPSGSHPHAHACDHDHGSVGPISGLPCSPISGLPPSASPPSSPISGLPSKSDEIPTVVREYSTRFRAGHPPQKTVARLLSAVEKHGEEKTVEAIKKAAKQHSRAPLSVPVAYIERILAGERVDRQVREMDAGTEDKAPTDLAWQKLRLRAERLGPAGYQATVRAWLGIPVSEQTIERYRSLVETEEENKREAFSRRKERSA